VTIKILHLMRVNLCLIASLCRLIRKPAGVKLIGEQLLLMMWLQKEVMGCIKEITRMGNHGIMKKMSNRKRVVKV